MKRLIASVIVVVAFTFYAIFSRGDSSTQTMAVSAVPGTTADASQTSNQPVGSGYSDGTYTGSQVDALYGMVQVQVTVEGGLIADIQFLSCPTGHHSDQINAQATPVLIQEAISSQSASVQVVSGATLTSRAFMESLQSALSQA